MNILLGTLIVAVTIYLLLKNHDYRMILIGSGLLMAGIALDPLTVLDEFAHKMVTDSLIQAICSSLGFGFIMRATGCEKHFLHAASRLNGHGLFIIPLVTITTFMINAVLMSAANTAAAAGCVFIPLLIRIGVHPVIAATAILAGTFGSMLNPELPINTFVAKISGVDTSTVVSVHTFTVLAAAITGAMCLTIVAMVKKQYAGYTGLQGDNGSEVEKINLGYAIIPLVPLTILVLGSSGLVNGLRMGITQAMLVGTLLGLLATRTSPALVTQKFFEGMGSAYANGMGMVIAVAVFVRGMKSIGLVSFFVNWLTTTPDFAHFGAAFGPFFMGLMTGSGDAAAFAFSEAIAPHASIYGLETVNMGSMSAVAGALGRTMSPLAGAAVVCASIAGVNPIELAKNNFWGMVTALILTFILISWL